MDKQNDVKRPTDCPMDGPADGIKFETECIRTDFIKKRNGTEKFRQREKSKANITASVEMGVFSIRDTKSDVMLTVTFRDVMEVIAQALDKAKQNCEESDS